MNELLTADEVGRECRSCVKTVYTWIREGRLRATRLGRRYRIKRGDLLEFLSNGQTGTTSPTA